MATTTKRKLPLRIIPLGGLDGIGKNMTAIECGQDMILIDAGPSCSPMTPSRYRPGPARLHYVLENEDKPCGIVITHGHEDHTGSLPYLLENLNNKVPIFSSKLTLGFIEGKLADSVSAPPSSARCTAAAMSISVASPSTSSR